MLLLGEIAEEVERSRHEHRFPELVGAEDGGTGVDNDLHVVEVSPRALGEPVLVTGSLYLLGDLAQAEQRAPWRG